MDRKKNWNFFRKLNVKNKCSFLYFSLLIVCASLFICNFSSCNHEELIVNTWNLQTVLMNGEPLNDSLQFNVIPKYTYYIFFYANVLTVKTVALGKVTTSSNGHYEFVNNTKKSEIKMDFTILYEKYKIIAKIVKLTKRELNLEYEFRGNTYLLKLYAN